MMAQSALPSQGRFYEELGIWIRVTPRPINSICPALFLDRDGVIVEDPGYLSRPSELVILPGACDVIASANRAGIPVVEITNQAGIARSYFGWNEFLEVEEALARQLAASGATVDGVFACPYHRDGAPPWNHPEHPARKPQPGMLLAAEQFLNLDLRRSWIVGDKLDDLLAGYNAGLRGGLHVLTGYGLTHRPAVIDWNPSGFDLRFGNTVAEAAQLLQLLTSGTLHSQKRGGAKTKT